MGFINEDFNISEGISIYQKGLNAQGGLTCLKEGLNAY